MSPLDMKTVQMHSINTLWGIIKTTEPYPWRYCIHIKIDSLADQGKRTICSDHWTVKKTVDSK